ncbi:hypothetical protein ORD22_02660 [Sporosarcina sp. GW1-11]|uniref:hypothetical protein n=1 Tax=Sporosarcina sp. GW1-11 TaxID=2899126 RepID=UPI00294D4367|nr:hypothetical protein [Sporosarcina sp. GW1-11]MDV6377163.1 hypothetical protein [Sporosarcina sp. GW1-11]
MALGILMIVFIVLLVTAVIIQILLYRSKNESNNYVFFMNMLFGVLLSYMAFSALPMNFTGQRVLAIAWGVVAVLAVVVKLTSGKFIMISKIMLSVAIIGGLVQLFL